MNVLSRSIRIISATLTAGVLTLSSGSTAVTSAPAPVPAAQASDEREGPQFYTGLTIDVSGKVIGDVYASGQSVTISGDVTGDVIAAAQTITITGTVDGDVRLAGQDVTVVGTVSRSGTVVAANLIIGATGGLGDDLVGSASAISIDGDVGRDVLVSVGSLDIRGAVGRNVTYHSDREARITEGAVHGSVEQIEPPQMPKVEVSPWAAVAGWFLGLLYAVVSLSLITLLAGLLFPRLLQRVTDQLLPTPWRALMVGFLASLLVPLALLMLLVTIVGAPLAVAGMLVWVVLSLATFVHGAYYLGRLVFRGGQRPTVQALVGGLILITALQVPWLNIAVWLTMVFFGLGAQLLALSGQNPWRTTREADAVAKPSESSPATPAEVAQPPS